MSAIEIHADAVAAERAQRLAKLGRLRERGVEPYPAGGDRTDTAAELRARFDGLAPDADTGETTQVAGRVVLIRRHGGLVFLTLTDQTGSIQLLAARDALGDEAFAGVESLDRGDWVSAGGTVMTTHTGELTVEVAGVQLLSKALRALPRRVADAELRVRERYLDLIVNPETRQAFDVRSAVIASVRATLAEHGFAEVETPVLEAHAGGAAARPFVTHHNALDVDMYLRIALELHLKRLVVGGFERVFEIGRVFRNEGLDPSHNPEFTLLEAYQALADYRDMMTLVETIVSRAALAATGTTVIRLGDREVDLAPPWRRATMAELVEQATGERMHPAMPLEEARAACERHGVRFEPGWAAGRLMAELYEATAESALIEPTFVLDHPREVSPLARAHRDDDTLTERFEAIVGGRELANAYTELNDPVDQRERFEAEGGPVDEDYLRALEYGLPPTGGLGIGIDRLVMLIAGVSSIREAILFPALRPESPAPIGGPQARPQGPPVAEPLRLPAAGPHEPRPEAPIGGPARVVAAPARRSRAPRVLGRLTGLMGVLLLFAHLVDGEWAVAGPGARVAGHVATAVIGFGLLVLAAPLGRGQRRAWTAATTLTGGAAFAALVRGPDPADVVASTAMLVALVWHRPAFTGRPDPGSLAEVLAFLLRFGTSAVAFGVVTLLVEHDHVREPLTAAGVLETAVGGLFGAAPYDYTGAFFASYFPAAQLALGLTGLGVAALLAFRAVRASGPSPEERERARALVRAHGEGTLDYFALRPDKSYFFSAAGDAMVAYARIAGHALVAGDPIGAPGSHERVVAEFLAHCREQGLRAAFLGAHERDLPMYERHGLSGVYLGDEAVIRCDRFSLEGGAMKGVRTAVTRVGRVCGFELMRESDASPELREQLNELRRRWRAGEAERGFTMELGGGVRGDDPELLLAVATDGDDRPLGFLRLVPCGGEEPGWSLDLMQHDPDAPNGMTEFLIARTAEGLAARGYRRLSLNFATWGRLFAPDAKLSPVQRVQRRVAQALSPHFQIVSLRRFNAKFDPEWAPRMIVVEELDELPKVALLYASAEGFVRLPVIGSRLVPAVTA